MVVESSLSKRDQVLDGSLNEVWTKLLATMYLYILCNSSLASPSVHACRMHRPHDTFHSLSYLTVCVRSGSSVAVNGPQSLHKSGLLVTIV